MKLTTRENFRVEFKGTVHLDDLPGGGGPFASVASTVTVAGSIDPLRLGQFGFMSMSDSMVSRNIEADYQRRCEDIARLVREQFRGQVKTEILCDTTVVCSFCGCGWEVCGPDDADAYYYELPGDGPGLPVCCERAQAEWRAAQTAGAA